jgi:nucleoside-diphosphate-sugar epimerase
MKVAVVTGGTGFLGQRLVQRLCSDGWSVHVLTRRAALPASIARASCLPWSGNPDELCRLVGAIRPSVAFHLAVHYRRSHAPGDIDGFCQANVHLGMCLLEALRQAGSRHLIHAGTVWQQSGPEGGAVNLYAATKLAFAEIARHYAIVHGIASTSLLLADSYAEEDVRPRFLTALREAHRAGRRLEASGGEQVIDLLHADDITNAFIAAADMTISARHHAAYTVPSGESQSLRALVSRIESATEHRFDIAWGARPYAADEVFRPVFAAPALPGWQPHIPLDQGLARFFAWSPPP